MVDTLRTRKTASDRRAEIQQTALQLAFDVGPDMVTTGMIAQRMGLTQPSIYKHFPRKEDIWIEVAKHLTTQIRDNLHSCRASDLGPVDRLRLQVMDHLRLVEQNPSMPEILVLRDLHKGQTDLRDMILQNMAEFHSVLVDNVKAAQDHGTFRQGINAGDVASLILGIIQSLVLRMLLTRNPAILTQEGERLLNLQLSGFSRNGE